MRKNPRLIDLTGNQFGRWRVLCKAGNSKGGAALWRCMCACGVEKVVRGGDLRSGKSVSCGCIGSRATIGDRRRTHGDSATRLYRIWKGIHTRCTSARYSGYHGRGIRVSEAWADYDQFKAWALSSGYSDDLSIDRINNDGDYEPSNCRWANDTTQARNTRRTLRRADGRSWVDIAEENGIPGRVFRCRYFNGGWTEEEAATRPVGVRSTERPRLPSGRFAPCAERAWRR